MSVSKNARKINLIFGTLMLLAGIVIIISFYIMTGKMDSALTAWLLVVVGAFKLYQGYSMPKPE